MIQSIALIPSIWPLDWRGMLGYACLQEKALARHHQSDLSYGHCDAMPKGQYR